MPNEKMTATEMFDELVRMGYAHPAEMEPSILMEPTAYISVPTLLAFATPPIPVAPEREGENAKLESRTQRDKRRKKRSVRR